jgi:serine O-acetyltransferase
MFFHEIREDFRAILQRDPAARSGLEVLLCYPSIHAMFWYRVAHILHRHHLKLLARMISQSARFWTGIEIHPGAAIGPGLFIDHGSGVVVGETCEIGQGCTLYQQVTLGGTGKGTGKRHPTLRDHVLVGAGAKVLGPIVLNDHVKVGAGSVVLKDVPDGCTVVGNPGTVVRCYGRRIQQDVDLDHGDMPDPVEDRMNLLQSEIDELRHSSHAKREDERHEDL